MSAASQLDSHDEMRGRDVNKVARGEQAPRPVHESGIVSKAPPPSEIDRIRNRDGHRDDDSRGGDGDSDDVDVYVDHDPESSDGGLHLSASNVEEAKTAPADIRFPFTNQTRHCYTRYLEYHKCIRQKGEDARECEKFAKYYRSLCPSEWIERWNDQRANGTFPGSV